MKFLAAPQKIFLWPCFFLVCFAFFIGIFWFEARLNMAFLKLQHYAASKNIELQKPELDTWPPAIRIKTIIVPFNDAQLIFKDASAGLKLLPPRLHISCRTLGGQLNLDAALSVALRPQIKDIKFSINKASLNDLLEKLGRGMFAQILAGKINANGEAELNLDPLRPDWQKIQGTVNINLDGAAIKLLVPVLKNDKLENINGKARLFLRGSNIVLDFCRLSSAPLSFNAQGELRNWPSGQNCLLNLKTELQAPETAINANLIPQRTREKILQKGVVHARLTGTLSHPDLFLEK